MNGPGRRTRAIDASPPSLRRGLVQTLVRASHECGPRIGFEVTAAKVRSVWGAPPIGWVTVLAGLLARGFSPCIRPSQFPSGRNGCGSPLTVAGAATAYAACVGRRSVFPLASERKYSSDRAARPYEESHKTSVAVGRCPEPTYHLKPPCRRRPDIRTVGVCFASASELQKNSSLRAGAQENRIG
jgi:hypothetical protein